MSDDDGTAFIESSLVGLSKAAQAGSDQLSDRDIGITVGDGLAPPYPPDRLAALQELSGTHAVAIAKKAQREVGFGYELVPHERADDPSDEEFETIDDFWHGRDTVWRTGPRGTPAATPEEILEKARQDYYGIGWLAIEILYAGFDDSPAGLAYLPAKSVRVKSDPDADRDEQVAGHGFVQKRDGRTTFFAEAGDRQATDVTGAPDPTYVDRETGVVYESRRALETAGGTPANELLFIPNPHPNTLYYGLPTWVSEIQTMVADQEARRFNRERLSNDMILDYAIIVEGGRLSEDAREDIRANIQGLRDNNGPGALILEPEDLADSGIDIDGEVSIELQPMSDFSDEDMSWTEYRSMNERQIAQVHEVPRQLLGYQDATNSNTDRAVREFTQEVIKPAQERFAERLYRVLHQRILGVSDWTLEFVTKGGDDEERQAEILATELQSGGQSLTINEVRERLGEDPIPELEGVLVGDAFAPKVTTLPRDVDPGRGN